MHVSFEEYESKIELEYESGKLNNLKVLEVKGRGPLPPKDLKKAMTFVKKYHNEIVEKWTTFFVKNNKVKNEVITQKI